MWPIATDRVESSVSYNHESCKSDETVRDAVWDVDMGGPLDPRKHVLGGLQIPTCERAILRVKRVRLSIYSK